VHEAFAEPVNLEVQGGLVVPDEPPAKIQEVPPAEKPEGSQFVWVPGYWAWDADRHGYIWVSACWRAAPPNMYWVPGYWAQVPEGWEWMAGFWAPTRVQKIEYLPAPPALGDVQSLGSPPLPDDLWVPPCQFRYQGRYVLRPGYWVHEKPGWVWVPSHYIWTPRGCVFAEGHWDYSLDRRGVLFAPVYLPRRVYERRGFSYPLSIIIDLGALRVSLFTYPRYSHYCFGDYYDPMYARAGIYPRFESGRIHAWYDPLYQYDRWQNQKSQPRWEENQRHQFDLRQADRDLRPPRTYREIEVRRTALPEAQRRDIQMAQPLSVVVAAKSASLTFEQVKSSERRKITQQATDVHKFREQRNRWESTSPGQKTLPPLPERGGRDFIPRTEAAGALADRAKGLCRCTDGTLASVRCAARTQGDQTGDHEDPQAADHRQVGRRRRTEVGGRPAAEAHRGAPEHSRHRGQGCSHEQRKGRSIQTSPVRLPVLHGPLPQTAAKRAVPLRRSPISPAPVP
jgi:hypothetical protein